jgi:hypothetical protein
MAQQEEVIELLDSDSEAEAPARTINLCESSDDDNDKFVQPPKNESLHQQQKRRVSLSQSSSVKEARRSSLLNEASFSDDDCDDLLLGGPIFSNKKPSPATNPSQYPLVLACSASGISSENTVSGCKCSSFELYSKGQSFRCCECCCFEL